MGEFRVQDLKFVRAILFFSLCPALLCFEANALGLLVPAYFSPGSKWTTLNDAARRVPVVAIMNPNNGPGISASSGYTSAINAFRQAGGRVIGYVYSSYSALALNDVAADIDRYFSFYKIDGIFVDEMTNDSTAAHVDYYEALYRYVKAANTNYIVIGNPGINAAAAYVTRPTVDTLVTFENNTGYEANVPDPWTKTQGSTTLAHLCYAVTNAGTMTNYVNIAVTRNAGYIYVTDDSGNNPWDQLPTYLAEEIGVIELINKEAARQKPAVLNLTVPNTNVLVAVSGAAGRYVLQTSNNFTNWQPAATNVSATGNLTFQLPKTNATVRVFRTEQ